MAAFNSAATGNWNAGPTWGSVNNPGTAGVDYPGTGDSATISTHTVTVPVSTTSNVGTAPDNVTTYDLVISSTGQLVINGTLNCVTNFDITGGGVVTVNGGGVLNFDPSARSVTKEYRFRCGNSGTGKLVLNDNATVTAPSGSAWYQQSGAISNAGQLDINGTEGNRALVQRMVRSADARGWLVGLSISSAGKFEASHCTFDGCDDISFTGSGTYTIRWEWCRWMNSTGTQNLMLSTATVTKELYRCTFDKNPNTSGGWGSSSLIKPVECYFDGNFTNSGSTGGYDGADWCIKRSVDATDGAAPFAAAVSTIKMCRELLWHNDTSDNPHGRTMGSIAGPRGTGGWLHQYDGLDNQGDVYSGSLTSGLQTIQDVMLLPNTNGRQSGTWLSAISSAGTIAFNRVTGFIEGAGTQGISIGEGSYNDVTGYVVGITNCLAVQSPDGTESPDEFLFQIQVNSPPDVAPDPLVPSGADYNWIVSPVVKTRADTYSTGGDGSGLPGSRPTQTTPTAANDVYSDDCDFPDYIRRLENWAAWWGTRIGSTGDSTTTPGTAATTTNARLQLLQLHDGSLSVAVATDAIQTALKYLTRGRIPRNTDGRANGSDGKSRGYLGAWAPAVTIDTVSASGLSATTNAPDGTYYVILVPDGDQPDWFQDVIDGLDGSLAEVPAANKFTGAVSGTTISCTFTGATLGGGNYRAVLVHVADDTANGWVGQEVYLRASEPVTSAAFQAAAGGGTGSLGVIRSAVRSPFRSPFTRRAA